MLASLSASSPGGLPGGFGDESPGESRAWLKSVSLGEPWAVSEPWASPEGGPEGGLGAWMFAWVEHSALDPFDAPADESAMPFLSATPSLSALLDELVWLGGWAWPSCSVMLFALVPPCVMIPSDACPLMQGVLSARDAPDALARPDAEAPPDAEATSDARRIALNSDAPVEPSNATPPWIVGFQSLSSEHQTSP